MSDGDFLQRIAKLPPERLALLAAELKTRVDRAEQTVAARNEPLAIVGMGCRFPAGGDDPEGYWQLLRSGVDAIREVPPERWNLDALFAPDPDAPGKIGTRSGGFFESVDQFDARFFGIAPREAVSLDPQQRLLLEVTWEALEDAGVACDRLEGSSSGVFVGLCNHDYHELLFARPLAAIDGYYASGSAPSMAAGRIAYLLGLQGPAITIDTACSSSLVALHLACESLRNRECRLAVCGGVNLILGVETMIGLTKAHMISPDGRCRTFDERADGIGRGEGCGVVVLKRLGDALADGDRLHALIRATAVNQDGRSIGITAPNGAAQEALMRSALESARLRPRDVDYVEAHGTGTRLGDPIEVRALGAVYGGDERREPLQIGSVKTNLGHLEAAAGIAALLKVVLSLKHRELPPHLHLQRRNPLIDWDQWKIEIPTRLTMWRPASADGRLRAAVSSFGFSGTNAHAIVEEVPSAPMETVPEEVNARLLPIYARSEGALRKLAVAYAARLGNPNGESVTFADICRTAAVGRARMPHRLVVVADSREAAAQALREWSGGAQQATAVVAQARGPIEPVFLFTGQGSQYIGMGAELYMSEPLFKAVIDRCAAAFRAELDVPLTKVLFPSVEERDRATALLATTRYAQPALFSIEYALAELWRSWGIEPAAVAGHSIGEFAAAACVGAIDVEAAARLVAVRGRLMQSLPSGAMAAIFAEAPIVDDLVREFPCLDVAALNAPGNTVIAGVDRDIDAALAECKRRGLEARRLNIGHAFHSSAMDPILDALADAAAAVQFRAPEAAFYSTMVAAPLSAAELARPTYWRDQARRSVRFADTVRRLRRDGHEVFLEIGPHPTLCSLAAATLESDTSVFLPSLRRGESDRVQLLRSAAGLHVRGTELDWRALDGHAHRRRASLPTYAFERTSYWAGWSPRARGEQPIADATAPVGAEAAVANVVWARAWHDVDGTAIVAPTLTDLADNEGETRDRVRAARSHRSPARVWLALARRGHLSGDLAAELQRAGLDIEIAKPWDDWTASTEADAGDALTAALAEMAGNCGVLHLLSLDERAGTDDDAARIMEHQHRGTFSALLLARTVALRGDAKLIYITRSAQPVGGIAVDPNGAPLWGLGRVIAAEHPELDCRCIDLPPDPQMEVRTLSRLIRADNLPGEDELALRDQRVFVPRIVAVPHQTTRGTATCRFDEGSYVVTGGTAGLGLRVASWLAERGARRLVLNSRNAPSDDARRSIDALRARGVDVRLVQGDVADDACVAALLDASGATQLRGVLHCAGVIDDAALIHQTWRHLENVMHAKVVGAWNLHRATRNLALEHFVMFSSAAAFLGSSGQSNYAAANAYLGGLAEYRRALGLQALAIDWGPWTEVGAATRGGVLERARAAGLHGMDPVQGLEILGRLMASDSTHVAALDVDWSLFLNRYPALRSRGPFAGVAPVYSATRAAGGAGAASKGSLVSALEASAPGSRRAKLFDAVHAEALQALGMAVGEAIDPHTPLAELGLDSLMAVQLRNALSARLGRQLPATLLFTYPTLELVTEHLAGELGLAPSVIETAAADELEGLSEDELAALLERRLGISKAAP